MTTTAGTISVQFARIRGRVSLDAMAEHMRSRRFDGTLGGSGWGNVHDGHEELINKVTNTRPNGGRAEILTNDETGLRQLRARFYWHAVDKAVVDAAGNPALRFRATDVLVYEDADGFVVAMGSRNEHDLGEGLAHGIREMVGDLDSAGFVEIDNVDPLGLGDRDIFVWLMYRNDSNQALSTNLTLVDVRAIECEDATYRNLRVKGGAAMDRGELLAPIIDRSRRWGPAKLDLYSNATKTKVYLEIWPDGSFAIFRGGSQIDPAAKLTREAEGLALLQETLHELLPDLVSAHLGDVAWRERTREEFYEDARRRLHELSAPPTA